MSVLRDKQLAYLASFPDPEEPAFTEQQVEEHHLVHPRYALGYSTLEVQLYQELNETWETRAVLSMESV